MEKVVLPHSPMGRNKQGGYPLMRFRIWSQVDEEAMFERNQVPSRSWDLVAPSKTPCGERLMTSIRLNSSFPFFRSFLFCILDYFPGKDLMPGIVSIESCLWGNSDLLSILVFVPIFR